MSPKPVFLDVDSTIVEKNLRITSDPDDEFNNFLENEDQYPSKLIKPTPGFCIKTKEVGTEVKVFINICQTDALPSPKEITETELTNICSSDEICNYRIPLSIGELRTESDKKGCGAKAIDVAINPNFFSKIETSILFKNFFLTVVFEGLRDKHNLHTTDDRVILKNRKAYGNLQLHRIQQREIDNKIAQVKSEKEISLDSNVRIKPKIEILSSTSYSKNPSVTPKYRLFKRKSESNMLYGEIKLPDASSSKDFVLDIGEDRLVFRSNEYQYLLDLYFPCSVNVENVTSTFNPNSKILTIKMATQT